MLFMCESTSRAGLVYLNDRYDRAIDNGEKLGGL